MVSIAGCGPKLQETQDRSDPAAGEPGPARQGAQAVPAHGEGKPLQTAGRVEVKDAGLGARHPLSGVEEREGVRLGLGLCVSRGLDCEKVAAETWGQAGP